MPTPPGLTFTGINDQTYPEALGPTTHKASAGYTNPPMPCSQLLAEWRASLQAAHWTIDEKNSTFGGIEVKRHGYLIIVNISGTKTCDHTIVGVS